MTRSAPSRLSLPVLVAVACLSANAGAAPESAAPATAQTKKLGTFGGWEISIGHEKGKFVRCVADTTLLFRFTERDLKLEDKRDHRITRYVDADSVWTAP